MDLLCLTTKTTRLVLITFSIFHVTYHQMPINKLFRVQTELYRIIQILPFVES